MEIDESDYNRGAGFIDSNLADQESQRSGRTFERLYGEKYFMLAMIVDGEEVRDIEEE